MQHFDIRITGEAEDAAGVATSVVAKVALSGARIHHASLDGREVHIIVDHVEVKSDNQDGVVRRIADAAGDKLDEQKGE